MAKRIPNTQIGSLTDHQHGTNDTLTSSSGTLYGDALTMFDNSTGGNATLTGGVNAFNFSFAAPGTWMTNPNAANKRRTGGVKPTNTSFSTAPPVLTNP